WRPPRAPGPHLHCSSLLLSRPRPSMATTSSPPGTTTRRAPTCSASCGGSWRTRSPASPPSHPPSSASSSTTASSTYGCDASVLLDGTYFSESEKDALPNASLRGFEVIDEIKSVLEHNCPATVSCADVLALASRDAVTMLGGPAWSMPLGRMDSRTADRDGAENLPSPRDNYTSLVSTFRERGLDARDMTALSGAHTVGMANCHNYRGRIYGTDGDTNIDPSFAETRRQTCPDGDNEGGMAPFDEQTPMTFDNAYYKDLIARRGLLSSDQALYGSGGRQDDLVEMYSRDGKRFAKDFAKAMVKMGNIRPSKGTTLEVRLNCKMVN
uniref:Peroxidase n=1 Tax=Aegilops tauschii subsp. strangulata TaxID=200361 RepID=A0A453SF55_AEGTS